MVGRQNVASCVFLVAFFSALAPTGLATAESPQPMPLASMDDRGANLPPVGRSLFDFLVAKQVDGKWVLDVPYPFEALVDLMEAGLREGYREPVKRVLHPLGRSLHRHAAEPEFFKYPRAVTAVDTDSAPPAHASGMMLKDRLYLGYQPVTDSVELIAYNEAAGRFEYQVVTDYREGGTPQVTYADRGVCTACHHNQALIYSDQPWAESNNNPRIAALLRDEAADFYGIPAQVPFDIPESYDEATDRANYFAAYQLAWNEACAASGDAVTCRRDGLIAALRYRLTSGYQLWDPGGGGRDRFAAAVARGWLKSWPAGVEIPTPNLPDFDPFADGDVSDAVLGGMRGATGLSLLPANVFHFEDIYEPLYERPALELWRVTRALGGGQPMEPRWLVKVIAGLGDFFAAADIERLDTRLAAWESERRRITVTCRFRAGGGAAADKSVVFHCGDPAGLGFVLDGRFRMQADGAIHGVVPRVRAGSAAPGGLELKGQIVNASDDDWSVRLQLRDSVTGLNARLADGRLLESVHMSWNGASLDTPREVMAELEISEDFEHLVAAIDRLADATRAGDSDALAGAPFRRVAVMRPILADFGLTDLTWCCMEPDHLPPAVLLAE